MSFRTSDVLKYIAPFILATGAYFAVELTNGDYSRLSDTPVGLNDISPATLERNEDKFVTIYNQCTHEGSFWYQKGADEFEYYPIKNCEKSDTSRVLLIGILSGDADSNWEKIDNGELDFWSGRLIKGIKVESEVKRLFKRSNINYDSEEVWMLKIDETPKKIALLNKRILVTVWIISLIGLVVLIVFDVRKKRRNEQFKAYVKLKNVLNNQQNNQYELVVEIERGDILKSDYFVINRKIFARILRADVYQDANSRLPMKKLIIDKEGVRINWKAMFNKHFGIEHSDHFLE